MGELPEFGAPPVVEVALGVQFRALPVLRGLALAPLRDRWRDRYPRLEEQPPLPATFEGGMPGGPAIQLSLGVPSMRYWFLTRDGSELVQVQQDRLSVNWRDSESGSPYPRYPAMRQLFADRFADLEAFVADEGSGPIRVQQAELSYVNAVGTDANETQRLERILSIWQAAPGHHLGEPEQARVEMSFKVKDLGSGVSRLWVQLGPGQRKAGTPALFFTLSIRGMPQDKGGLSEVLSFLDEAHGHVVRSFAELTTPEMHAIWRLRS
jgi:uncharacterized protein (TIGR04255 family)